jgi:hypothetical protein
VIRTGFADCGVEDEDFFGAVVEANARPSTGLGACADIVCIGALAERRLYTSTVPEVGQGEWRPAITDHTDKTFCGPHGQGHAIGHEGDSGQRCWG